MIITRIFPILFVCLTRIRGIGDIDLSKYNKGAVFKPRQPHRDLNSLCGRPDLATVAALTAENGLSPGAQKNEKGKNRKNRFLFSKELESRCSDCNGMAQSNVWPK